MTVTFKSQIKIKIVLLKILFSLVFMVFVGRLVWLQLIDRERYLAAAEKQQNLFVEVQATRGTIYDRNMRVLAQDIDSYTYYVVPENIKDKYAAAVKLKKLTGISGWPTKFKKHPRFLYVARKTSKESERKFEKSGIETLRRFVEPKRVYPSGGLALAVLGRVDVDNNGLSGLEHQYNEYLSGINGKAIMKRDGLGNCYLFHEQPIVTPSPGRDLVCTIDLNLQQIVEQEMTAALRENDAAFGIGLFIKAGTGEILACAVLDSLGIPSNRNRAIADQYEPGSTFKLITTALALSSGKFELSDSIFVENGKFRLGRRIIRDDHEYDTLSVGDILVYSSNIGVSKMALQLGDERLYKAIKEAGFVNPLGIDFPGEAGGFIQKPGWREHYLANISFGHGVSASPLQIVVAYDAVASDGYLSRPLIGKTIIEPDGSESQISINKRIRRVFSSELTNVLNYLLCQVVERGTATRAKSNLVRIAGKTGTALKIREDGRGYDHKKARASFVGYFPVDNPMVVGLIMFDEPKTSRYGGETAAPVFKNIAERYYCLPEQILERYAGNENPPATNAEYASANLETHFAEVIKTTMPYYNLENRPEVLPDFKGLTVKQALRLASMMGIDCEIDGSGIVVNQTPAMGTEFNEDGIIKLRCDSK